MKLLIKLFSIFILMMALLFFNGCEKHNTVAPEINRVQTPKIDNGLKILPLGNKVSHSLKRIITSSKFITVADGGTIKLEHDYDDGDAEVELKMSLNILPNSINQDTLLWLQIDDDQFLGEFGVDFYPHSIAFNTPAIFNIEIEVEDIDPLTIDTDNLDIYYDNPETGMQFILK
jgi:hypothetical protein